MSEKKKPQIGIGVVVTSQKKVLLGKRKGSHCAGDWSFPGGHLELKESVEACAARELQEETGLRSLALSFGPWTEDVMENDKHYITLFVYVDSFEGEVQLLEPHKCEGWKWFDWDNLPSPLFSPTQSFIQKVGISNLQKLSND